TLPGNAGHCEGCGKVCWEQTGTILGCGAVCLLFGLPGALPGLFVVLYAESLVWQVLGWVALVLYGGTASVGALCWVGVAAVLLDAGGIRRHRGRRGARLPSILLLWNRPQWTPMLPLPFGPCPFCGVAFAAHDPLSCQACGAVFWEPATINLSV